MASTPADKTRQWPNSGTKIIFERLFQEWNKCDGTRENVVLERFSYINDERLLAGQCKTIYFIEKMTHCVRQNICDIMIIIDNLK